MDRIVRFHPGLTTLPEVLRLGLASRGEPSHAGGLTKADCLFAFDRGVNYFNWTGANDGMSQAVATIEKRGQRSKLLLAVQLPAEGPDPAGRMRRAVDEALAKLHSSYLDVVTLYYIQSQAEWDAVRTQGAYEALMQLREAGKVRCIGLTSHQRPLAAAIAAARQTEMVMIRYNAAHRGAETEIFPATDSEQIPVVAYTALRWGALIQPLPSDPTGTWVPTAVDCYRFVLSNPSVRVALTAPASRLHLNENLRLLDNWRPMTREERQRICLRGDKVKAAAGHFP